MTRAEVLSAMQACFEGLQLTDFRGQTRVVVARDAFLDLIQWLRTEQSFACLVDITCVDYQVYREARQRFGMVYLLMAGCMGVGILVSLCCDEPDVQAPPKLNFRQDYITPRYKLTTKNVNVKHGFKAYLRI